MPDELIARLSDSISQPELSKMWESERSLFTGLGDQNDSNRQAPELVITARDGEVMLTFPSGGRDPEHRKLKAAFERAVERYRPDVKINWSS